MCPKAENAMEATIFLKQCVGVVASETCKMSKNKTVNKAYGFRFSDEQLCEIIMSTTELQYWGLEDKFWRLLMQVPRKKVKSVGSSYDRKFRIVDKQ